MNKNMKQIVMLGTGAVGKSSITIQFVSHYFAHIYNPTIEDSFRTNIKVDDEVYSISIMDTAGQEEFDCLKDTYIRGGDGFVIVYSITSQTSFIEASNTRDQIYRVLDKEMTEKIPIVLVGNKCDLEHERQVQKDEVEEIAKNWNVAFLEASAKCKTNIDLIYETIMREILKLEKEKEGYLNELNENDESEGKEKKRKNSKRSSRNNSKNYDNNNEKKECKKRSKRHHGCVIV